MTSFYFLSSFITVLFVSLGSSASVVVPAPGLAFKKTDYSHLWSGCYTCSNPESAFYDKASNFIFISNVVGGGDKKDGQGWIQKIQADGKLISAKWVQGLNAPKGLRSYKGTLWVSDIDQVVGIEISSGKITQKVNVVGAKFLNDIAIDSKGVVYVSDTVGNKIYMVKNGESAEFMSGENLDSPNGLLIIDKDLYMASWGHPLAEDWSTKVAGQLYKISLETKEMTPVTKAPLGNLDGLEADGKGGFYVSDWVSGKVFRVTKDGETMELFSGMKGSADIGFIEKKNILLIPRMKEDQITAYDLKKYPQE